MPESTQKKTEFWTGNLLKWQSPELAIPKNYRVQNLPPLNTPKDWTLSFWGWQLLDSTISGTGQFRTLCYFSGLWYMGKLGGCKNDEVPCTSASISSIFLTGPYISSITITGCFISSNALPGSHMSSIAQTWGATRYKRATNIHVEFFCLSKTYLCIVKNLLLYIAILSLNFFFKLNKNHFTASLQIFSTPRRSKWLL